MEKDRGFALSEPTVRFRAWLLHFIFVCFDAYLSWLKKKKILDKKKKEEEEEKKIEIYA